MCVAKELKILHILQAPCSILSPVFSCTVVHRISRFRFTQNFTLSLFDMSTNVILVVLTKGTEIICLTVKCVD